MLPGERFKNWIDGLAEAWKDRLRGWVLRSIGEGVTKFAVDLEPGIIDAYRDSIVKIRDNPRTPPDIRKALDRALVTGNIHDVILGSIFSLVGFLPALLGAGAPIGALMNYDVDLIWRSKRLDPMHIMSLIRRSPEEFEKYIRDLEEQGWSGDRIEALKRVTQVLPTPRDIVGFLAHEVFEDKMIEKYSLLSEWGDVDKEFAKVIGLEEPILKLYWMDHWEHPEWGTIRELRHRDQITDQDVKDWFRLVEIPEYWRPKMLEVLWGLPNRIEIRMMARYLDMSKEDIMDLLKKAGLHEDYRSDAADFMMIMGLTGYWADMLSKGWMTPEEVKADIDSRKFREVTADRIYKRLVRASQPEKVTEVRDLTVAQIIRWVKLDVPARRAQGIELLVDLNYTEGQADFIMEGYLGEMGSPKTFEDFKDITQKYKRAIGTEAKPMPEELKKAAAEVVRITGEVEALQRSIEEEEKGLVAEEILPEEATARLTELRTSLHRAEAELSRVKLEYDRLVAEWRHGSP